MIYETLQDFLAVFIGNYNPVTYIDSSGAEVVAPGLSGVDFTYIVSAVLLCIVIYSLFRIVGGLICQKY